MTDIALALAVHVVAVVLFRSSPSRTLSPAGELRRRMTLRSSARLLSPVSPGASPP